MKFKKFGKYTIIKKLVAVGWPIFYWPRTLSLTGFGRFNVIKKALTLSFLTFKRGQYEI